MSREIQQELNQYFLPRELLAENRKADGKLYRTWRAFLKEEYWSDRQPVYVILKEISPSQAAVYHVLSQVSHPNLEKVYGVIESDDGCLAVNEYILPPSGLYAATRCRNSEDSMSLEELVTNMQAGIYSQIPSAEEKTRQAFLILLQLCEALEVLHGKGLIHGDIHPNNILIIDVPDGYKLAQTMPSDYCVKLIDFDNTKIPKEANHKVTRLMGTKPFAAPEILDFSHPLDRADIYSLGCIFYYILCGVSPKEDDLANHPLPNQWTNRIFRKCTASYEARYCSVSALKKDLQRALHVPGNPVSQALHKLPGFRSYSLWKMAAASYVYLALLLSAGYALFSVFQTGLPIQEWQRNIFYVVLFFITEIIFVFDGFFCRNSFRRYSYWKTAHPFGNFLFKLLLALLIFFLYGIGAALLFTV